MEPTEASSQPSPYATYPSLRDRVVLITGGASGIGACLVEAFVAQQARVAFVDVQREAGERLQAEVQARYDRSAAFFPCDLTQTSALREVVQRVTEDLGSVDVLVNNAGNDTRHATAEVTSESWDAIIAVNLKHQFFMTQAVLPAMREKGRGSIIQMSSISWMIPSTGLPVYVTAKAAVVGLTRTLAHELGPFHIRVNCVLPGAIMTERQKQLWFTEEYKQEILASQALKRFLVPEDVARLVLFLAADDSAAITSQSYIVDGGWA